ncbi:unnamed protein product [Mytilus coruscus]|uniref:Reverse transcriptase domain-containing protein n=1 Tax=Mytilus coruscus TaxID=42192 RepID=A0A6J8BB07_MYTCO|nr:unnamed protein product [Mytilus coruscus]
MKTLDIRTGIDIQFNGPASISSIRTVKPFGTDWVGLVVGHGTDHPGFNLFWCTTCGRWPLLYLKRNPFQSKVYIVPKITPGERRVILDLSFPFENCIDACIDKDIYLGESVNLTYPSVDDFINLIKLKGRHCGIFKRDLKRAYRQIPIDPGDINFVGFHWKNHIFVNRVLSMGLRSSAHICQRVTSSVVYMMKQSGYLLLNYLDDFAGAEKSEDANFVFDLLGRLLDSCGLEESVEKASSPSTVMTFLGVEFNTSSLQFQLQLIEWKRFCC